MERESFIFYKSFLDAAEILDERSRLVFIGAIATYGITGTINDNLPPIVMAMMKLVIPQLDANNERYANGKKGGRPRKKQWPYKENDEKEPNENASEVVAKDKASVLSQFRNDVQNSTLKIEQASYSLGIDSRMFSEIADKIISEWEVTDADDITWRHLVNSVRMHLRQNKSPANDRTEKKRKLIQDINSMNQMTIKNGAIAKDEERPAGSIW